MSSPARTSVVVAPGQVAPWPRWVMAMLSILACEHPAGPGPGDAAGHDVDAQVDPQALTEQAEPALAVVELPGDAVGRLERRETVDVLVLFDGADDLASLPRQLGRVVRRFGAVPAAAVRLSSRDGLEHLRATVGVARIVPDAPNAPYLAQSLSVVGQPGPFADGFDGAGATVAVLDTGVRYSNAAFGACAAPGAPGCKVVWAQDFAPEDGQQDDGTNHGTNVAAVVAGMAPGAGIIALDVFSADGLAYSSHILAAIDWLVANKETYGIVAANLSLGNGAHSAACPTDALAVGMRTLWDAGIVPVVSTGNDGYTNQVGSPACAPHAISVGAVYDAAVGGLQFSSCADATTTRDQVTCFSNAAAFVSMLAPGGLITAGGSTMAGTSQASPHVAGAVAVLAAAFPAESPEALRTRLTASGAPVTDARNGLVLPRLDLSAALAVDPEQQQPEAVVDTTPDTTPPAGSFVINSGATVTRAATVSLTITATDASGVASACVSESTPCTAFGAFSATRSFTLAKPDGKKTVRVWLRDTQGNTSPAPITALITLDTTLPTGGKLTATPGSGQVSLAWSGFKDVGTGLASYRVVAAANAPGSCGSGTVVYEGAATSTVHTGLVNGTTTGYRVCALDGAGNVAAGVVATARPLGEFDPPVGTIQLAAGAGFTAKPEVAVAISATDATSVTHMCLATGATCTAWTAYKSSTKFVFPASNGPKTLRVWFKDGWGTVSAPVSDAIVLDLTAPKPGVLTAAGSSGTLALTWSGATDAHSGVAKYRLVTGSTAPATCSSGTLLYEGASGGFTHTGLVNGKTYAYRLCAIDAVGNTAAGVTLEARPAPEYDGPKGTVVIAAGVGATAKQTVTLTLSATDAHTVSSMWVSNTASCTDFVTYTAQKSWTLLTGTGTKKVSVWFRDQYGNVAAPVSDTVVLDLTPPPNPKLTATSGSQSVSLSWTAPVDPHSGVASYTVRYAPTAPPGSCTEGKLLYTGPATAFTHTGVKTVAAYRVCATDTVGNTSAGAIAKATPLP